MRNIVTVQAVLLSFQTIMYFGCEIFQHRFHDVKRRVDDRIPFLPATSLIYSLWFPLIAVFPIVLYKADRSLYLNYLSVMVYEIILSVCCYLIYPTTFERPKPPDTFFGTLMGIVYKGSYRGLNCAPSLHCSSCYLILWMSWMCQSMSMPLRLTGGIIAFLIICSTVTTKQHTVIDVISAVGLFGIALLLGIHFPLKWVLNFI